MSDHGGQQLRLQPEAGIPSVHGAEPLRGIGDQRTVTAFIQANMTAGQPARPARPLGRTAATPVDLDRDPAGLIHDKIHCLSCQLRADLAMPIPGDRIAIDPGA